MREVAPETVRLRAENAGLRERLRQMEQTLGSEIAFTIPGMTRMRTALLACLYTRKRASRNTLLIAAESVIHGRQVSFDAIDVHICHLRRLLRPLGVGITTVHGEGYMLRDEALERLSAYVVEVGW